MLSIFPELFNYPLLAPFILRLALAIVLLQTGLRNIKEPGKCPRTRGWAKILGAVFLVVGFLTQAAAILVVVVSLAETIRESVKKTGATGRAARFLVFAIALSLLFLGPGMFAVDLPL